MIYEIRTYDVMPRMIPEVEKRFGEAYEKRKKYSELAAFWHTEIGPLNQIIHVWKYKDLAEREQIRAAAVRDKVWPPKIGEFLTTQRSDIMIPFPFMPEMVPSNNGPFFEMRTYTYGSGMLPVIMSNWEEAIEERLKVSPVTALWYSELGGLNKFVHVWPYKSLDQRWEIRNKMQATGNWPPSTKAAKAGKPSYQVTHQENKIVMPSSFSPTQ